MGRPNRTQDYLKDEITQDLLNNSYSDIPIVFEFRYPSIFICMVRKSTVWYWGFSGKLINSYKKMIYALSQGIIVGNPNLIPIDAEEGSGHFVSKEGEVIPDPLSERVFERHGKQFLVKLSCKDYKYIIAKVTAENGQRYEGTGSTAEKAISDLFNNINLQDVNLKKTLPGT